VKKEMFTLAWNQNPVLWSSRLSLYCVS